MSTKKTYATQIEPKPLQADAAPKHQIRLLSKADMLARVGVSYSSVWNWIIAGTFPPGRALSDGKRGRIMWVEAEIEAWIASRPVRLPKSTKQVA
jgi:predicted DNA-binding transcriptional regulator AlpA